MMRKAALWSGPGATLGRCSGSTLLAVSAARLRTSSHSTGRRPGKRATSGPPVAPPSRSGALRAKEPRIPPREILIVGGQTTQLMRIAERAFRLRAGSLDQRAQQADVQHVRLVGDRRAPSLEFGAAGQGQIRQERPGELRRAALQQREWTGIQVELRQSANAGVADADIVEAELDVLRSAFSMLPSSPSTWRMRERLQRSAPRGSSGRSQNSSHSRSR